METKNEMVDILPLIAKGANDIAQIVGSTMGARGKNVIIAKGFDDPMLTADGVTVARQIVLKRDIPGIAGSIIRQGSIFVSSIVGDGTTAAIVLGADLTIRGIDHLLKNEYPRLEIIKGFNAAKETAIEYIESNKKIIDNLDTLKEIATISVKQEYLGKVIGEAVWDIGVDGIINVQKNPKKNKKIEYIKQKGYSIDKGYNSLSIPAEFRGQKLEIERPVVAMFSDEINFKTPEVDFLVNFAGENKCSIIILALGISPVMSDYFSRLHQTNIHIYPVDMKTSVDEMQDQYLDLITISNSNGFIINEHKKKELNNESLSYFEKAVLSENKVLFIKDKLPKKDQNIVDKKIAKRISIITKLKEENQGNYYQRYYGGRIAKLQNGIGILIVSGPTAPEVNAIADFVDDGVKAAQAALKSGYVEGGGKIYANIRKHIDNIEFKPSEQIGVQIFKEALLSPMKKILDNAGMTISNNVIFALPKENGFDVVSFEEVNLFEKGIIDPASVCIAVLNAAVSTSTNLISTGAIVFNEDYDNTGLDVNREIFS